MRSILLKEPHAIFRDGEAASQMHCSDRSNSYPQVFKTQTGSGCMTEGKAAVTAW